MEWAGPVGKATPPTPPPPPPSILSIHSMLFLQVLEKKNRDPSPRPHPINALFTLRSLLLACEKVIDGFGRWTLWRLARGRQTNCPEHVSVILMSGGVRGWGQNKMGGEQGGVTATQQPRNSHAVSEKDSEETVVDVGGRGGASGDKDFAK